MASVTKRKSKTITFDDDNPVLCDSKCHYGGGNQCRLYILSGKQLKESNITSKYIRSQECLEQFGIEEYDETDSVVGEDGVSIDIETVIDVMISINVENKKLCADCCIGIDPRNEICTYFNESLNTRSNNYIRCSGCLDHVKGEELDAKRYQKPIEELIYDVTPKEPWEKECIEASVSKTCKSLLKSKRIPSVSRENKTNPILLPKKEKICLSLK